MAKITGPLMSASAAGNWGKGALQFRAGASGRIHAYRPADPTTINQQPASAAQETTRQSYRAAVAEWQLLDDAARAGWNERADSEGLSGWNLFLRTALVAPTGDAKIRFMIGSPPRPLELATPTHHRTIRFTDFLTP